MARPGKQSDDEFSDQETQRRVKAALRGAFSGPPTPLKDIPKKRGESRLSKAKAKSKKMPGKTGKPD